ncbi:MAG: hypothetical protein IPN34_03910 [Planctomycetes bacterium]|nr:hypothetical protein [Planctomycetota bacterium]
MNLVAVRALLLGLMLPLASCVILSYDDPSIDEPPSEPTLNAIEVEGLGVPVMTVSALVLSEGIASTTGYRQDTFSAYSPRTGSVSGNSSGSYRQTTRSESTSQVLTPATSYALLGMAVHHLENCRAAKYVNSSRKPELVVRGSFEGPESYGGIWSVPLNIVFFFGLVLPQTWGHEYTVSLRAYAPDGQFLKEYSSTVAVRSWHHWARPVANRADGERRAAALASATIQALNALVADLRSGELPGDPGNR